MVHRDAVSALELPQLVHLGDNLYAASFGLMKLLPARFILDRAREAGRLEPGSTLVETTSGTFGLALAMLCALRGYRLILVSDPAVDPPFARRLRELGACLDIVEKPAPAGGYQQARLDRLAEHLEENPEAFWPSQYDNVHNAGAYAPVAEQILEALGRVDCLVGTVGSGGSVCGTAHYLRLPFEEMTVVGIDTHGSVLFGQPEGKRLLRGLGNSLMPKNVDHALFDEVHWVSAAEAFHATRQLHRRHVLFKGPTSGAAYMVARHWAQRHPSARVVALLPDDGHRYQSTVFDDEWLQAQGVYLAGLPEDPVLVRHPADAGPGWCWLQWGRRRYEDVVSGPYRVGHEPGVARAAQS
ncbi:MAG TPA: cysteine synthase family protein [Vicinamibacteria bacterium]|nr:cysteine synthase family protein [Vicinamibacteria bacterium]